jgi:leucyl aminopeptidase
MCVQAVALLLPDMQPRVLHTRAGITVENGNTDAEGR